MIRRSGDQMIRCVEDQGTCVVSSTRAEMKTCLHRQSLGVLPVFFDVASEGPVWMMMLLLLWCGLIAHWLMGHPQLHSVPSLSLGEEPSDRSQRGYPCVLWSCQTGVCWRTLEGGCSLRRLVKPPNCFTLLIFSEISRFWKEIFICEALRAETQPALFLLRAVKHHDRQDSACTHESLVCNPQTHITAARGDTTVRLPGPILLGASCTQQTELCRMSDMHSLSKPKIL